MTKSKVADESAALAEERWTPETTRGARSVRGGGPDAGSVRA